MQKPVSTERHDHVVELEVLFFHTITNNGDFE